MILEIALLSIGLVLLLKGASLFTENSSRIAKSLGMSDIVIGLTLVAFTTSLPELAVSVTSVVRGSSGIAMGNIIGSNIANIGLVLGISALLTPGIRAARNELKQGYIMVLVTIASVLFIIDGLSPVKGLILVSGLLAYVYYLSKNKALREGMMERIIEKNSLPKGIALCAIGGAGVLLGAELMVSSGIIIASSLNISETLVGLTIIAVGTSLPELATSFTAAAKKLEGIALGNIIGSNIFNLMMVMGVSAMAGTITMEASIVTQTIPMMLLMSVLLVLFMRMENRLGRLHGAALLLIYGFFLYTRFFFI